MALWEIANVEKINAQRFRSQSKALGEFLRGDFRSIRTELNRVFPNTDGLQERFVPLVARYAHELSGMYARPLVRRFDLGAEASPDAFAELREVYDDADVDGFLHELHRGALVQSTMIAMVWPGDEPGRVRLQAFEPWQVEWTTADPNRAADLRAATKVALAIPRSVTDTAIVYGRVTLTPTEAWRDVGNGRVGVYRSDGINPLGRIPLVVLRLVDPAAGQWAAPVNEALLTMQLALCVSESDTELLVHTQAWGQRVIEGAQIGQQVEQIQVGPDKVLALVNHDGPDASPPRLSIVQGQPPLAQITSWNESRLRLLCSMFDLSPDVFLKHNTATTASARAADARDRAEARDRVLPRMRRVERELARLIVATINATSTVRLPRPVGVDVRFSDWEPPVDPLHESQALEARVRLGIDSPIEFVANRDGVPRAEAERRVRRNLDELRAMQASATPTAESEAAP